MRHIKSLGKESYSEEGPFPSRATEFAGRELSDEELEGVTGGMQRSSFEIYKIKLINSYMNYKAYSGE